MYRLCHIETGVRIKTEMNFCFYTHLVPSSSGLGRLVLIQKIACSTPAGITNVKKENSEGVLVFYIEMTPGRNSPAGITKRKKSSEGVLFFARFNSSLTYLDFKLLYSSLSLSDLFLDQIDA